MSDSPDASVSLYVLVDNQWQGPFAPAVIRQLLMRGQVKRETATWDPQDQVHGTVGSLSATRTPVDTISLAESALERLTVSDDAVACADLGSMTETLERDLAAGSHDATRLERLVTRVESAGNAVAKRSGDAGLGTELRQLRRSLGSGHQLAAQALSRTIRRMTAAMSKHPDEDGSNDQFPFGEAPAPTDAQRVQVLEREIKDLRDTLEHTRKGALEQREATGRLVKQASVAADTQRQDTAELRALAAEIHDLASSRVAGDQAAGERLRRLAGNLRDGDAGQLAPAAEAVLRDLAKQTGDGTGAGELARLRADFLSSKSELTMLRQREEQLKGESERLHRALDEGRKVMDQFKVRARERERQLQSSVAALQASNDLHKDTMDELQAQLGISQNRVEAMEGELDGLRRELKAARGGGVRDQQLQAEMTRLADERARLESQRQELQVGLTRAEADLVSARAQATQEDHTLVEAMAAKVNQLRLSYEQTRARLGEQETQGRRLQEELLVSRTEADELRTRSESLTTELEAARGGLEASRRRLDELSRTSERLAAEREDLQRELAAKRGPDAFEPTPARGAAQLADDLAEAGRKVAALEAAGGDTGALAALRAERDRFATDLADARRQGGQLTVRMAALEHDQETLSAERDRLRQELHGQSGERERIAGELAQLRADAAVGGEADGLERRVADLDGELATVRGEADYLAQELAGSVMALADAHDRVTRERARALALEHDLAAARTQATALNALVAQAHDAGTSGSRPAAELSETQQRVIELEKQLAAAVDVDLLRVERQRSTEARRRVIELERRLAELEADQANDLPEAMPAPGASPQLVAAVERAQSELADLVRVLEVPLGDGSPTRRGREAEQILVQARDRLRRVRGSLRRAGDGEPPPSATALMGRDDPSLSRAVPARPGFASGLLPGGGLDSFPAMPAIAGTALVPRLGMVPLMTTQWQSATGSTVRTAAVARPQGKTRWGLMAAVLGFLLFFIFLTIAMKPGDTATVEALPTPEVALMAVASRVVLPDLDTARILFAGDPEFRFSFAGLAFGATVAQPFDAQRGRDTVQLTGGWIASEVRHAWLDELRQGGNFTVAMQVLPDAVTAPGVAAVPGTILALGRSSQVRCLALMQLGSNLMVALRAGDGPADGLSPRLETRSAPLKGGLQHLVLVRRGDALSLYVDGALVSPGSIPGDLTAWEPAAHLSLGADPDGANPWRGTIRRLHWWPQAFDVAKVRALHEKSLSP